MYRTPNGLDIVKAEQSEALGYEVALTRKTTKSGNIRHGVVLTFPRGRHVKLRSYLGIAPAFALYKKMLADG